MRNQHPQCRHILRRTDRMIPQSGCAPSPSFPIPFASPYSLFYGGFGLMGLCTHADSRRLQSIPSISTIGVIRVIVSVPDRLICRLESVIAGSHRAVVLSAHGRRAAARRRSDRRRFRMRSVAIRSDSFRIFLPCGSAPDRLKSNRYKRPLGPPKKTIT